MAAKEQQCHHPSILARCFVRVSLIAFLLFSFHSAVYRYPATEKGVEYIAHNGHSSHVTRVAFTGDGKYLFSAGGHDLGLFQWRLRDFVADPTGLNHVVV
jgi:WD40 repeat protein